MKKVWVAALAVMGLLSSCNSQNSVTVNGEKMELNQGIYAKFETTHGDILVELNTEETPLTTANFVALAEGNHPEVDEEYKDKPFYDGLIFHRVIPNFMIQGGDPDGSGMGGPGYKFDNEIAESLSHKKGVISMANSGPNTNGSQFFITVAKTPQLDGSYNVFGEVKAGQSVADSISKVDRNNSDRPDEDVVMQKVTIIRKGKEARNFDAPKVFSETVEAKKSEKAEKDQAKNARLEELKAQMESTESGLHYQVLEEGDGAKPENGQKVLMDYSGYLLDGTLFDTSIESVAKEGGVHDPKRPYQPYEVTVGPQARVIQGWKEALGLMQVGDKYKLLIPPQLGYGNRGAGGVIPPNSHLIFEVEMLEVKK